MKMRLRNNYFDIICVVMVVLAESATGYDLLDPCLNYITIGDTKRTTTEDPGVCGGICDSYIIEGKWYRLDAFNSGARMPESCVKVWHCGTYIPIWLNGAHPTVSDPGPASIPVCAQLTNDGDCCGWRSLISVKWCTANGIDYYVYALKPPPYCDMAYCAGNGINCGTGASWNDIIGNCTSPQCPIITADPVLSHPYISQTGTGKTLSLNCTLNFNPKDADDGGRFDVVFVAGGIAGGETIYSTTLTSTSQPVVVLSENYIRGHLNQDIICRVTSYWQSQYPSRCPYRNSNSIKLGVTLVDNDGNDCSTGTLTIGEGQTKTVTVKSTFPIIIPSCANTAAGSCNSFYTFRIYSSNLYMTKCTFKIGETGISDKIILSPILDGDIRPGSGTLYYMNTDQTQSSILSGFRSETCRIIINDVPFSSCSSTGDPHISTFYGGYFHTYLEGDFTLVKIPSRQLEVQVRHWPCNVGVTCNCGIIAREGNNIIGINYCPPNTAPLLIRYQYDETYPGGYIVSRGYALYRIYLPSGMYIDVDATYPNVLHIYVYFLSDEGYEGLCKYSSPIGSVCTSDCNNYRVSDANSFFRLNEANPPNCLSNVPIVPHCDCTNGGSTNVPCYTPDQSILYPTWHTCKSPTTRRKRDSPPAGNTIPNDGTDTHFNESFGMIPPSAVWPTPKNGINETQANAACSNALRRSLAYNLCVPELKINITTIIQSCVKDVQALDNTVFPSSLVASQMELLCHAFIDNVTSSEKDSFVKRYDESVCPQQCNQQGNCISGTCSCNTGYDGADCSLKPGQAPNITKILSPICDIQDGPDACRLVYILASYVSSTQLSCQFQNDQKGDENGKVIGYDLSPVVNGQFVICNVPPLPVKRNNNDTTYKCDFAVRVSISNDRVKYSNEQKFVVYNSMFTTCDIQGGCTPKKGVECSSSTHIAGSTLLLMAFLFIKSII